MASPTDLRAEAMRLACMIDLGQHADDEKVVTDILAALTSAFADGERAERERCVGIARERARKIEAIMPTYFAKHRGPTIARQCQIRDSLADEANRIASAIEGKEPT